MAASPNLAELAERADELGLLAESNQVVECCPECLSSNYNSRLRQRPRYKCLYCDSEFNDLAERPPFSRQNSGRHTLTLDYVPPKDPNSLFADPDPEPDCGHLEEYQTSDGCLRCDMAGFKADDMASKRIGSPL